MTTSAPQTNGTKSNVAPTTASAATAPARMVDINALTDEQKKELIAQLRPSKSSGPGKALLAAYLNEAGAVWEKHQTAREEAKLARKPAWENPFTKRANAAPRKGGARKPAKPMTPVTADELKAMQKAAKGLGEWFNSSALVTALGADWKQSRAAHVANALVDAKKFETKSGVGRGRFAKLYSVSK